MKRTNLTLNIEAYNDACLIFELEKIVKHLKGQRASTFAAHRNDVCVVSYRLDIPKVEEPAAYDAI